MITVEELVDGEVSPWMVEVAARGRPVRGPRAVRRLVRLGRVQTRAAAADRRRLRAGAADVDAAPPPQRGQRRPGASCWSRAREADDVLYARELETIGADVVAHLHPPRRRAGWTGYARRVDRAMLQEVALPGGAHLRLRPDDLRGVVANHLVALGHEPANIRTERFGDEADDGASRRQRGRGRAVRGLHARGHHGDRDLRRLRRRPARSRRRMVYEAGMGTVLRCPACDAVLLRVRARARRELRWRCAASGCCAGEPLPDDAQRVALEDRVGARRDSARAAPSASGSRSAAVSIPPSVGLMKPSRSEPSATCSGPIASMWRREHVERLVQRLRVRAPQAVVDLVLGEDQPDHAAAGGDPRRSCRRRRCTAGRRSGSRRARRSPGTRAGRGRSRGRAPRSARTSRRSRPRACG